MKYGFALRRIKRRNDAGQVEYADANKVFKSTADEIKALEKQGAARAADPGEVAMYEESLKSGTTGGPGAVQSGAQVLQQPAPQGPQPGAVTQTTEGVAEGAGTEDANTRRTGGAAHEAAEAGAATSRRTRT